MRLTKLPVVLVLLTAGACRANIVLDTSRLNESTTNLVEALVYIVTSCYGDSIDAIGLYGNLPDTLITTLSVRHSIPVVLFGNLREVLGEYRAPVKFRHKLHLFVVRASTNELRDLMDNNIGRTVWWNHMASFIILDMSPDCRYASDLLYLSWEVDMINAKVLCYRYGRTVIFNFNPFTSQAPSPWYQFAVFPGINTHPFTVFAREYRRNKTICENLDFDKTQNLGGYVIRVLGINERLNRTQSNRGAYEFASKVSRLFDSFHDTLNATLKYSTEIATSFQECVDIERHPNWILYTWGMDLTTYPHEQIGHIIVSQFRGHKSQLNKILYVIDQNSRYGMIIVYLISFMFFKFFVRQDLVAAFLNLVRITCDTGFENLPGNTASRIYLGCLLFFAVTMQGIYQGNLASLLTTVIPLPNVNTIQDLLDLDYEVCVNSLVERRQNDFEKSVVLDFTGCITKVKNDPSSAYLSFGAGDVIDLAQQFKLHISPESFNHVYVAYPIRWEWPLEERVNIIFQKFVEANILDAWDIQCDPIKLTDFEFDEAVMKNKNFKNIELGELAFAFVILGIGLMCATVTLIIELAIKYEFSMRCYVNFESRRLNR